jgi:Flp pilus assembly protein TadG
MRKMRSERGQALAIFALMIIGMMGVSAIVMDVGFAWYAKRQLQSAADAAALAGAQDLPSLTQATARAQEYADKNTPDNLGTVNYAISTKCTAAAGSCAINNAVVVEATAIVPTWFARIPPFSIDNWNLRARAVAAHDSQAQDYDIVLAIDRTGSMCTPTGPGGTCIDLNNAKAGIRTLLGLMNGTTDQIGMVAFPPLADATTPICATPSDYDNVNRNYLADQLNQSYQNPDGSLNTSSSLYLHTVSGNSSACIRAANTTSYSFGLKAAKAELDARGRTGVPKIIIFMTDGEANIGPVYGTTYTRTHPENIQPCHEAIKTAQQIKDAGVTIYSIGYDLRDDVTGGYATCKEGTRTGGHNNSNTDESPQITSYSTLSQIASPGNFYNKPDAGQVNTIFAAIVADISSGTSRLVDEDY